MFCSPPVDMTKFYPSLHSIPFHSIPSLWYECYPLSLIGGDVQGEAAKEAEQEKELSIALGLGERGAGNDVQGADTDNEWRYDDASAGDSQDLVLN